MPNGWPQDVVDAVAVTVPSSTAGGQAWALHKATAERTAALSTGLGGGVSDSQPKDLTGLWIKKPDFPDLVGTHTQVRGPVSKRSQTMPERLPRHVAVGVAVPMPGRIDGGDRR
jgi:hypothetical protein